MIMTILNGITKPFIGYEYMTQRTTEVSALPKGCSTVVVLRGRQCSQLATRTTIDDIVSDPITTAPSASAA